MHVYCYRSGEIEFSRKAKIDGLIKIASGPAAAIRAAVEVKARRAYDGQTLLVPGVPEAASDDDALIFVEYFRDIVGGMSFNEAMARRDVVGARNRALEAAL